MKRSLKYMIFPGAAIVLILLLWAAFTTATGRGGQRTDVCLTDYTVSGDGTSITLEADVCSSAGYLHSLETREVGSALYITFYGTAGVNSRIGAKRAFPVELPEGCTSIYFLGGGGTYDLVLEKNGNGTGWFRPS